jgi:two-component system alkaline phosphatase synthesis response regulator PhoP
MNDKILIVDDELSILTLLEFNLKKAGFEVVKAMNGEEAITSVIEHQPALIVLDVMLPKKGGVEVCKELKMRREKAAILMLTAKDEEFDKILSLELGADDYMTKPFSVREVIARIKAILRRINVSATEEEPKEITVGELSIFPEKHEAYLGKEKLDLTLKEFELLVYFAKNIGRLLTREQIFQAIWGYEFEGESRNLDVHISHLREKTEVDRKEPKLIKTIRGMGYKMENPRE